LILVFGSFGRVEEAEPMIALFMLKMIIHGK
jgi:hypothetical protein